MLKYIYRTFMLVVGKFLLILPAIPVWQRLVMINGFVMEIDHMITETLPEV